MVKFLLDGNPQPLNEEYKMSKLIKTKITELKGLNGGNLYELVFLKTRAAIEKKRKFCGYYQARKLYIEPSGDILIESLG